MRNSKQVRDTCYARTSCCYQRTTQILCNNNWMASKRILLGVTGYQILCNLDVIINRQAAHKYRTGYSIVQTYATLLFRPTLPKNYQKSPNTTKELSTVGQLLRLPKNYQQFRLPKNYQQFNNWMAFQFIIAFYFRRSGWHSSSLPFRVVHRDCVRQHQIRVNEAYIIDTSQKIKTINSDSQ